MINLFNHLEVEDFYYWTESSVLGSGLNGYVKLCSNRKTGLNYALKTVSKMRPDGTDSSALIKSEIQIMSELDHPNILRLFEYFESHDKVFLILEICSGGHLLDSRRIQNQFHYPEKVVCKLVRKMLRALKYLHSKNIVHCDLKLENFLFQSDSINSQLKLIDFGLSQRITEETPFLSKPTGTPYYVAPEVLAGKYEYKCDVWAIGVIAYKLLSGSVPFYGRTDGKCTHLSVTSMILLTSFDYMMNIFILMVSFFYTFIFFCDYDICLN